MKILILNGPNLNLLGLREPDIYGTESYQALLDSIDETCRKAEIEYEVFQSNHEGALVDKIQEAYGKFDGIIINPAAYTHTSVALLDALKAVGLPTVEVHLSDINRREPFRKISYVSAACVKTITGKGFAGYWEALLFLKEYERKHRNDL